MAWLLRRASRSIAHSREPLASSQTFHAGFRWSVALVPIHEAKPSLSQRLSHQAIVTRLPNHWCAISCAMVAKTCCCAESELRALSCSTAVSFEMMAPQFSIAPLKPPGTAIWSSLGSG